MWIADARPLRAGSPPRGAIGWRFVHPSVHGRHRGRRGGQFFPPRRQRSGNPVRSLRSTRTMEPIGPNWIADRCVVEAVTWNGCRQLSLRRPAQRGGYATSAAATMFPRRNRANANVDSSPSCARAAPADVEFTNTLTMHFASDGKRRRGVARPLAVLQMERCLHCLSSRQSLPSMHLSPKRLCRVSIVDFRVVSE